MTWITDSHIHLSDPQYDGDIEHIISSMKNLNLKACCVSMDFKTSKKSFELAQKSELILPFIGVHPEKASEDITPVKDLIQNNSNKISGIGEIGLDKTYVKSDEDFTTQKNVFSSFLSLAEKLQKPISIHSRKTLDEINEILTSYSLKGVLLHWFDGNKKQLKQAMDNGFFVSFGPVMIYSKDKQVLLSKSNKDQILVETDGPVRFSKCFEFKPAQISFIPSVVFCAAKILRYSYDDLSKILEQNSNSYLGK